MATAFKLPVLGENIASGTIARVLVKAGDAIRKGQPVLEVETDKAVVEVPAPGDGTVKEVKVKDGAKVNVGDVIFNYEAGASAGADTAAAPAEAKASAATKSAPAPAAKASPKLTVLEPPAGRSAAAPVAAPAVAAQARGGAVLASPSVRRLAREMGVDLNTVPVSDPSGRVSAQDVLNFAGGGGVAAPNASASAPLAPVPASPAPATVFRGDAGSDKWGAVVLEPMNAIRRKTAEHMTTCWTTIPHVTHFDKADITALEETRKKFAKKVDAAGGKLTVTCFIVKVLAHALKKFPRFNASLDLANEQLVLKQYYHVGVAADTPNGLLVPVVRDVDQKSIVDIAMELPKLAEKARERKLALEDMQGGGITVSNLGGLGGYAFTPIVNAPEVAILGVSRSTIEPVFQNGQFAPRLMLPLSLSYDHRVIDGADAARFARYLCETLEQPWSLFLD